MISAVSLAAIVRPRGRPSRTQPDRVQCDQLASICIQTMLSRGSFPSRLAFVRAALSVRSRLAPITQSSEALLSWHGSFLEREKTVRERGIGSWVRYVAKKINVTLKFCLRTLASPR